MPSRRTLLRAIAAWAAGTVPSVAAPCCVATKPKAVTYEDGLFALFRAGEARIGLLALAHRGGVSGRTIGWLEEAGRAKPDLDIDRLWRRFETAASGDPARIERDLFGSGSRYEPSRAKWLNGESRQAVIALALLGQGGMLVALHARELDRMAMGRGSVFTAPFALALAKAGDWPNALAILERARTCLTVPAHGADIDQIWECAYRDRHVVSAMPILAETKFENRACDEVGGSSARERNMWIFRSYQIRAGRTDVEIPAIPDHLDDRYLNAVVLKIAASEHHPAEAQCVAKLRAVLPGEPIEMIVADYAMDATIDWGSELSAARAQILAGSKDYERAAELARLTYQPHESDPAQALFDAFIVEGDWHGLAVMMRERDPRKTRVANAWAFRDYLLLAEELVYLAARAGELDAAAAFVADAQSVGNVLGGNGPCAYLVRELDRAATLLAGVSEGHLSSVHLPLARSA